MKIYLITQSNPPHTAIKRAQEYFTIKGETLITKDLDPALQDSIIEGINTVFDCDAVFAFNSWDDSNFAKTMIHAAKTVQKQVLFENELMKNDKIKALKSAIAYVLKINFNDLVIKNRSTDQFVYARMIFTHFGYQMGLKTSELQTILVRDRTSIFYYKKNFHNDYEFNSVFRNLVKRVETQLN